MDQAEISTVFVDNQLLVALVSEDEPSVEGLIQRDFSVGVQEQIHDFLVILYIDIQQVLHFDAVHVHVV